jgi:hypothetical protein
MDNYHLNFDSLLMRPREDDPNLFRIIPPATLQSKTITITPLVSGGNVVLITNITLNFSNLISANNLSNILGVGWLERYRMTNLYDTLQQDLITYSMPHDNMYLSKDGKVVPSLSRKMQKSVILTALQSFAPQRMKMAFPRMFL